MTAEAFYIDILIVTIAIIVGNARDLLLAMQRARDAKRRGRKSP